jgi:hypothetical protein
MAENSNFTIQEHIEDVKFTITSPPEQQDSPLFNNTMIYILVSSLVIFLFFRLFCNFLKYLLIHIISWEKKEEKCKRHSFNNRPC